MKKRIFAAIVCLSLSVLFILALASCDAAGGKGNYAEDYAPGAPEVENGKLDIDLGSGITGDGEYERKIIKTADISAQTTDFDGAIDMIEALCRELGGYIENSSVSGKSLTSKGNSRYANYTLRIPAEKFDGFNEGIDGIVNVTRSTSSSDEVTSTYYDIKSRIEVLEMQKESLQKLYDEYTEYGNINYLLELQKRLYEVIAEIEAYETQIRLYDSQVAYSTVRLSISEVKEYTEEEEPFGKELLGALTGGWDFFLTICRGVLIVFVACLPFTVFCTVLAFVIVIICVSSAKKKRKKQLEAQQNQNKQ